ncbi:hypothetical protein D3C85_1329650 [compost metagenome]
MPAARPHAHALPLRHTKGGQGGQIGTAIGGAAGHGLDDSARQRDDGLLRKQVLFQAGDFGGLAAIVDPQEFGIAARPGVEQVFLPEVGSGVAEQRHAMAVRHRLAQHPSVGGERLRREIVDLQLRVACHAEPLVPRLGNSAS